MLYRHQPGQLPSTKAVLNAIVEIGMFGSDEHLSLLSSLQAHEQNFIAAAASEARDIIRRRSQRKNFSNPDPYQIQSWIRINSDMLHRDDGSRLGLTEERMVAYDALVLGPHHQTLTTDTQTLIDMAQILEDMNRLQPALNLYSRAAAQGQPQAIQAITEFGVNVEWLLLGMSASRDESMIPLAPSNVVGKLIERGSTHTISVFIERSHARNHVDLSVALGAIATMLASSNLPPRARRSARRSLERVASSSLEPLQDFAASSLASVDW